MRSVEDGNEYDSSFEKVIVDVSYLALLCYSFFRFYVSEVPFGIC